MLARATLAGFAGSNGAGKSSLLVALRERVSDESARHLPQELDVDPRRRLARELATAPRADQGRWLAAATTHETWCIAPVHRRLDVSGNGRTA